MSAKLSPVSSGVVHSTSHRTRLKVIKAHRTAHQAVVVKDAIEKVPGVQSVNVNGATGNVVITHDDRPDILENIGDALAKAAPDVLEALVMGTHSNGMGMGLGLSGLWAVGSILNKFVGESAAESESKGENAEEKSGLDAEDVKKFVPYAFLTAGLIQVLETEALLAGMAPLALFYYAFDTHWKFKQKRELDRMEAELIEVKKQQDHVSNEIKHIAKAN